MLTRSQSNLLKGILEFWGQYIYCPGKLFYSEGNEERGIDGKSDTEFIFPEEIRCGRRRDAGARSGPATDQRVADRPKVVVERESLDTHHMPIDG
ncbi:MAG: hypothetical protein ABW185_26725 [Sedimenticola sp.]